MRIAALFSVLLVFAFTGAPRCEDALEQEPPAELFTHFKINNRIDNIVLSELKDRMYPPSETCSDEVFLRRVFLDTLGLLPSSQEARNFLADKSADKRERLIAKLLERPEFADYLGMKWGDLLRIKAEFPSNLWPNASQAYSRWVHDCVRDNLPYDLFARKLLTASGSNFRDPPVNFFRAFQERTPGLIAENAALVFLGIRPDNTVFSPEQRLGFAAFFSKLGYKGTEEWKEEIVYFDPDAKPFLAPDGKEVLPRLPGKEPLSLGADLDPRPAFADWLVSKDNPWFAKCMVNRLWYWFFGYGIVNEPDDLAGAHDAWSDELLSYLEKEFVEHKFDIKYLCRLILSSNTYQLSAASTKWNEEDSDGFSHYRTRRLEAEPLIDIVCEITGVGESYQSMIPEPFTFLPYNQRAVAIQDGSITSPFLELFGKPPRNTSFLSERNSVPTAAQMQHFLNSGQIERKIEQSRPLQQLFNLRKDDKVVINEVFLRVLSRFPSEQERKLALDYLTDPKKKYNEAFFDIVWSLMNSSEFLLRH